MKKAYIEYQIINGIYHVELTINGEFEGGGSTGCSDYTESYYFACKLARAKGASIERYGRAA